MIDFEQDAAPVTGDATKTVAALCVRLADVRRDLQDAEAAVDAARGREQQLVERDIPDAMSSHGVTRIDITSLGSVVVDVEYYATITDANRQAAHDWLRAEGHGALIKNTVTVWLAKEQDTLAAEVAEFLTSRGLSFERKEQVHSSTLKAFAKEQAQAGRPLPQLLFGTYERRVAKIKPKKG